MKTFRCGDVVPGCTRQFTGSTDDILSQVRTHAHDDHGLASVPDELISQVRDAMVAA